MRTTRQTAHGLAAFLAVASAMLSAALHGQWEAGMDDDAGKAKATSRTDLPGADYGGKASGPSGLKDASKIEMKGSFRIFAAELEGERTDVVPDLTFTQHYGF